MKIFFPKKAFLTALLCAVAMSLCTVTAFAFSFSGGSRGGGWDATDTVGKGFNTGSSSTRISYNALSDLCVELNKDFASGVYGNDLKDVGCTIDWYARDGFECYAICFHYQGVTYWFCNQSGQLFYSCYNDFEIVRIYNILDDFIEELLSDICMRFVSVEGSVDSIEYFCNDMFIRIERIQSLLSSMSSMVSTIDSNISSINSNTSALSSIKSTLTSINTALTSIDNKISLDGSITIDPTINTSTSTVSGSVNVDLNPVVSSIDNLRIEMAHLLSYTETDSIYTDYYAQAGVPLYIPLSFGDYIDSVDSSSTDLCLLIKGRSFTHDVQPDGSSTLSVTFPLSIDIDPSVECGALPSYCPNPGDRCLYIDGIPCFFSSGIESGSMPDDQRKEYYRFLFSTLLADNAFSDCFRAYYNGDYLGLQEFFSLFYDCELLNLQEDPSLYNTDYGTDFFRAGGVTIISSVDITITVSSSESDYYSPLYDLVDSSIYVSMDISNNLYTIISKLDTIISKLDTGTGTTGTVDLTTIETTLSTIADKLDNTASNVENTVINITSDNDAYNVFYIEDEDGNTQSVTDFAGDLTGASGRLLSLLYRLVFADALNSVDSDLDNLEEFFTSEEPVLETASIGGNTTYEVMMDVWATS